MKLMRVIGYLLAIAALSLPNGADAQDVTGTAVPGSPSTIEGAERHTLRASGTAIAYQIDIGRVESAVVPLPANYRWPMIYVLDGNGLFPLAAQVAGSMVLVSNRLPGALVVAIGYPVDLALRRTESFQNRLASRTRDLTPTQAAAQTGAAGGGAAQFLAFIEQDLKPFVAARYSVDTSDQTLAGHSFGRLFAAWTLLNAPDAFSRYVLSSPALFWNDNATIKQAATFAGRSSGKIRVFISVGELETKERFNEDMVGVAQAFADALQRRKNAGVDVDVTLQVFPKESHISVVPAALTRGLGDVEALR